jgi:peroxiredoxin
MAQRGQWMLVLVIIGVLGTALVVGAVFTPSLGPVAVGTEAPPFHGLDIATGDSVGLDHFAGDVVLLNVWATWCIPCEAEMPSMQRLYEELSPLGFQVVAVSVDESGPERVKEWIDERELTFQVLHDQSGNIERTYQTIGVPETFIIDRDGVIVKKVIGATEWDHPTHTALLRELLSQPKR